MKSKHGLIVMSKIFDKPLSVKKNEMNDSEWKEEKEKIERRLYLLMLGFTNKGYLQLATQENSKPLAGKYNFDKFDLLKSFTDDALFAELFYEDVRNYASVFEVPRTATIAGFDLDRSSVLDFAEEANIMNNVELSKPIIQEYANSVKKEIFNEIEGIESFIERSHRVVERAEYLQLNFSDKVDYIIKHSEGQIYTPESFKNVLFEVFQEDNDYLIHNLNNVKIQGIRENTMTLHADLAHLVDYKIKSGQEDYYGSPLNEKGLEMVDLKYQQLTNVENNPKKYFEDVYNTIPADKFSHLISLDRKKSILEMIREKISGDESNIDYSGSFKIFDDVKSGKKFTVDENNKPIFDFKRSKPSL
jgi:hypothetical protein